MLLEKVTAIAVIMMGILIYATGVMLNIHSMLFDFAAGADVITGLVLLDGVWKGWIL